ncbi:MAG: glycosyltransferase family 9 protein [Candidatus Omnitrophica bacterium]|nr:glycosyltransferase family 9 protein [Candidatus Omnitrophota bacterium]MBU1850795.1 glycosyltransferase family 9 protein [Candidatus Omnitrophota bacterium]
MKTDRILITRTDRLGDVVISTPVIRFLREKFPFAQIAMLVAPMTCDVVCNNPDIDEVIIYDKCNKQKGLWETIKFAFALKKKQFDLAIALHPTNRVHLMLFIAGIPIRIGYDRNFGKLLNKRFSHRKQKGAMHEVMYNFDLLSRAGFQTDNADIRPYMVIGQEDKELVDTILREQGVGSNFIHSAVQNPAINGGVGKSRLSMNPYPKPRAFSPGSLKGFIVIHPGASCPSKRWPVERFAKVADSVVDHFGYDVVLVGAGDAEELSARVARRMRNRSFDLTDMLRVGELAEVLRRGKLLISNDSGPVHVATAVGTPVVCVFGRSDPGLSPKRWRPLGKNDIVLHKNAGCRECFAHNCQKDFACLKAITVDEAITAANRILEGQGARGEK